MFASHCKRHPETEAFVIHVKDLLETKGYKVFFDGDNLDKVTQTEMDLHISRSCVVLLFLDDKTFESKV